MRLLRWYCLTWLVAKYNLQIPQTQNHTPIKRTRWPRAKIKSLDNRVATLKLITSFLGQFRLDSDEK